MARTINFDFAQAGGQVITEGVLTIAPTQNWVSSGGAVVVPSGNPVQLVNGKASIAGVEPTPAAADGWRYQVQLETTDRRVHTWIVEVPTGTTPINFSALPVQIAVTLPLGATGAQLQTWIDSVHSYAASANTNSVNALGQAAALNTRVNALEAGGGGGGGGGVGNFDIIRKVGETWPARPSSSGTVKYAWVGPAPAPPIVASGTSGMRNNVDFWWRTA